jgi:hypothetical protein
MPVPLVTANRGPPGSPLPGYNKRRYLSFDIDDSLPSRLNFAFMKTSIRSVATVIFAVISFALLPHAGGVIPPPDGGYPGFNTAEGTRALQSLTTGVANAAVGWYSLFSDTGGSYNTAIGAGTLLANTGDQNTAIGVGALLSNTSGGQNTANGAFALFTNTEGLLNTATGANALFSNTTGDDNVAVGYQTLYHNTIGGINTAIGWQALFNNTEGNSNTATGVNVLFSNTSGSFNTASGAGALFYNTVGADNTATGHAALNSNTEGNFNTASGTSALLSNNTGDNNTAIGVGALASNTTGDDNTAIGTSALDTNTGSLNTALGRLAGSNLTTGSYNVCIGAGVQGVAGEFSTTRILNIGSTPIVGGINVVIDSLGGLGDGRLGFASSSRRYKQQIQRMEKASEILFDLKPVTFRTKGDSGDSARVKHYGLIAEEVATVDPDLVVFNREGKPETLRFDSINAMLLNEFLKEHRRVEDLKLLMAQQRNDFETAIARQQKAMKAVVARLNEQEAQIQKVSAQVDVRKSDTQMLVGKR